MNKSQRITLVTTLTGLSLLLFNQLPIGQSGLEEDIEKLQKAIDEAEQKEKEAEEAEGEREDNQSLESKYGNTTEGPKTLWDECVEAGSSTFNDQWATVLFLDKCKPIINDYETQGYYVSDIGKGKWLETKGEVVWLVKSYETTAQDCLYDNYKEHVLLVDSDKCQRVIEYYLGNGYDSVDKYDKKVELIKRQANQTGPIGKR
jgi:hypothetical protein